MVSMQYHTPEAEKQREKGTTPSSASGPSNTSLLRSILPPLGVSVLYDTHDVAKYGR